MTHLSAHPGRGKMPRDQWAAYFESTSYYTVRP